MFVVISGLGFIALFFTLPETKGMPLEKVAKLFKDDPTTIAALADGADGVNGEYVHDTKVHEGKDEHSSV